MEEEAVIVKAGYVVEAPNGMGITVTDGCAVGHGGKLYQTAIWREDRDRRRREWDGRPLWRRLFGISPKGWYTPPAPPLIESLIPEWMRP